jgi:hypothetical protein
MNVFNFKLTAAHFTFEQRERKSRVHRSVERAGTHSNANKRGPTAYTAVHYVELPIKKWSGAMNITKAVTSTGENGTCASFVKSFDRQCDVYIRPSTIFDSTRSGQHKDECFVRLLSTSTVQNESYCRRRHEYIYCILG